MKYVGYHPIETLPIKRGDVVTVPKGAPVRTTDPHGKSRVVRRTHKVKVVTVSPGADYVQLRPGHPDANERDEVHVVVNPSVTWAGSGGYWHEVDINLIPEANKA
jgi:mannose-6-phosphate isomerase-like protein (cupin superfamily)